MNFFLPPIESSPPSPPLFVIFYATLRILTQRLENDRNKTGFTCISHDFFVILWLKKGVSSIGVRYSFDRCSFILRSAFVLASLFLRFRSGELALKQQWHIGGYTDSKRCCIGFLFVGFWIFIAQNLQMLKK